MSRTYRGLLRRIGVTYPQYLVLSTLWEKDGQTISAIADRLALEPSTITPLMKRLEAAGFVSRQRNPHDERQVQVFLSAKGKALRSDASCLTQALLENSKLSIPQMVALNDQVRQLYGALTAR